MTSIIRKYPNSRIVNLLLLTAGMLAAPVFLFVLFGKWAESPMRQAVGFAALIGIWMLAFLKRKHEILCLAIVFLSQFMVSLASFELTKPVVQTIVLLDLLLIILVMHFIEIGEKIKLRSSVGWAFLALIVWQFAITPLSAHVVRSICFSITQAKFLLLYLIVSNLSFGDKFYRRLPWIICGILIIQTSLALLQSAKGGYLGLAVLGEVDPTHNTSTYFAGVLRAAGTLGATNSLGGYMAALLVLMLPFLLSQASIIRYGIFFLGLIGLVIPLSRAGWLSFLVGAAIVVFQMFRSRLISPIKIIALGTITIVMLSGVAYMKWSLINERFTDKAAQASAEGRLGQFPYAIDMSMKNPLTGIGPGLSYFYGSWSDFDKFIQNEEKTKEVHFNEMVHNSFLQYFLDDGLPGAIIFIWLVLSLLINALKKMSRTNPQQLISMGAGAAAFTCILHTQFGTEINNQQLLTVFAFALGISNNKYLLSSKKKYQGTHNNHEAV